MNAPFSSASQRNMLGNAFCHAHGSRKEERQHVSDEQRGPGKLREHSHALDAYDDSSNQKEPTGNRVPKHEHVSRAYVAPGERGEASPQKDGDDDSPTQYNHDRQRPI